MLRIFSFFIFIFAFGNDFWISNIALKMVLQKIGNVGILSYINKYILKIFCFSIFYIYIISDLFPFFSIILKYFNPFTAVRNYCYITTTVSDLLVGWFSDISTLVGYLMLNLVFVYMILDVLYIG